MPICTTEVITEILGLGYELPGVECKAAAPISNQWILGHVLRAMLGMANLQDGGIIILGISDKGGKLVSDTFNVTDLKTWTNDALAFKSAPHFDPAVRFNIREVAVADQEYFRGLNSSRSGEIDSQNFGGVGPNGS